MHACQKTEAEGDYWNLGRGWGKISKTGVCVRVLELWKKSFLESSCSQAEGVKPSSVCDVKKRKVISIMKMTSSKVPSLRGEVVEKERKNARMGRGMHA